MLWESILTRWHLQKTTCCYLGSWELWNPEMHKVCNPFSFFHKCKLCEERETGHTHFHDGKLLRQDNLGTRCLGDLIRPRHTNVLRTYSGHLQQGAPMFLTVCPLQTWALHKMWSSGMGTNCQKSLSAGWGWPYFKEQPSHELSHKFQQTPLVSEHFKE